MTQSVVSVVSEEMELPDYQDIVGLESDQNAELMGAKESQPMFQSSSGQLHSDAVPLNIGIPYPDLLQQFANLQKQKEHLLQIIQIRDDTIGMLQLEKEIFMRNHTYSDHMLLMDNQKLHSHNTELHHDNLELHRYNTEMKLLIDNQDKHINELDLQIMLLRNKEYEWERKKKLLPVSKKITKIGDPKYQTVPCRDFNNGDRCIYEEKCSFKHVIVECSKGEYCDNSICYFHHAWKCAIETCACRCLHPRSKFQHVVSEHTTIPQTTQQPVSWHTAHQHVDEYSQLQKYQTTHHTPLRMSKKGKKPIREEKKWKTVEQLEDELLRKNAL